MAAIDGFNALQHLSLLSKVCAELESHTGAADKVLAEFIIHLASSSDNLNHFVDKLKDNGALFPDYLVRTLFTVVHAVLTPSKTESETREEGTGSSSWRPHKKRISSPEKREVKQFTAAGNLSFPDDEEEEEGDGLLHQEEGDDEDLEIELNDDAPAFLQGKKPNTQWTCLLLGFSRIQKVLCFAARRFSLRLLRNEGKCENSCIVQCWIQFQRI
ncbi:hypothetical protein ACSQ67_002424 [Phaseolus vulgaris]